MTPRDGTVAESSAFRRLIMGLGGWLNLSCWMCGTPGRLGLASMTIS